METTMKRFSQHSALLSQKLKQLLLATLLLMPVQLSAETLSNEQHSVSAKIKALYEADQTARRGKDPAKIDWAKVARQDAKRRAQIQALLTTNSNFSADDYYHAALIMQHGSEANDYKHSMELAQKVVAIYSNHKYAKWLACASEDCSLFKIDLSQVWGTNLKRRPPPNKDYDIYYLINFDKTARSDENRVEGCGLLNLKRIEAKLKVMKVCLPEKNNTDIGSPKIK